MPDSSPPDLRSVERPSLHPALAGREREMGALSDAVRRLIELSLTIDGPAEAVSEVTATLNGAADRLEMLRPDQPHVRFVHPDDDGGERSAGLEGADPFGVMHDPMPFDVVIGRYNPLAPPIWMELKPPLAIGHCRFTKAYEGAPGWVHGAIIAAAFDVILTGANRLEEAGGPTVRLAMRYRRPTLIDVDSRFEAWIDQRTERRVFSHGRLLQSGKVTVEAEGEFAPMDTLRLSDLPGGRTEG